MNIKNTISFDEYNAIVEMVSDNCFPDSVYSPAYYELMFRTALITVFAPDYNIPDIDMSNYNEIWYKVTNDEAREILGIIRQNSIYPYLEEAVENAIDYKIKMLTSGGMSMSDVALSNLFDVITEKIENIDTSMLTKENVDIIIKALNTTKDNNFAENLVDTMLEKGLLTKPNRETRRKNIKQTKKAEDTEN